VDVAGPRVHDLGPLEVTVGDHREPIRGGKPATILRYLAIHADELVSVDAVVDAVWGEGASEGTRSTLDSHVFRLRKQLEPDRPTGMAPAVLLKQDDGLRLRVSAGRLDSSRFAALVDEAGAAAGAGRLDDCIARCDEALALWRGTPVGADAAWAQAWMARMSELRSLG